MFRSCFSGETNVASFLLSPSDDHLKNRSQKTSQNGSNQTPLSSSHANCRCCTGWLWGRARARAIYRGAARTRRRISDRNRRRLRRDFNARRVLLGSDTPRVSGRIRLGIRTRIGFADESYPNK